MNIHIRTGLKYEYSYNLANSRENWAQIWSYTGNSRKNAWVCGMYKQESMHFGELNLELWEENVMSSADENTAVDLSSLSHITFRIHN